MVLIRYWQWYKRASQLHIVKAHQSLASCLTVIDWIDTLVWSYLHWRTQFKLYSTVWMNHTKCRSQSSFLTAVLETQKIVQSLLSRHLWLQPHFSCQRTLFQTKIIRKLWVRRAHLAYFKSSIKSKFCYSRFLQYWRLKIKF